MQSVFKDYRLCNGLKLGIYIIKFLFIFVWVVLGLIVGYCFCGVCVNFQFD